MQAGYRYRLPVRGGRNGPLTRRLRRAYLLHMQSPTPEPKREWNQYVEAWRHRDREAERAWGMECAAIVARLDSAAELLRRKFGASRVGVFGSFARGDAHPDSDVDLYVNRVSAGSYWDAVAALADHFGRHVDLIELDGAPEAMRVTIDSEGRDVEP